MQHRLLFLCICSILLCSCGHEYHNDPKFDQAFTQRAAAPPDTLIVSHHECTECLDLYIDQGTLHLPPDVKPRLAGYIDTDIKVCGNFPMDLINMSDFSFDPFLSFKVIGKIIGTDPANGFGQVPLFYVTQWEAFSFDRHKWIEKDIQGHYRYRSEMAKTAAQHLLFEGRPVSDICGILGAPDHTEPYTYVYTIQEGKGAQPQAYLTVTFNKDSIVTGRTLYP